ncbi:hypothetical protein DV532_26580 (plasmid) [Pseudomonas sp. Leaf58]|uniref:hypothetical protein n=1 Tax=Pseudomonas sp. Leaf58 TaxID=1736226 RepID=UPI0006FA8509|nr:hypothetical protein [Pseudomonas sp. Leaf58]AYG47853.1 hypothetical protein DV532_26580 [Pseudomonas sp. Leaf58]KQN62582.1 hypothetical protein ASF02_10575 [Pseudomonas sp. Leaf58]
MAANDRKNLAKHLCYPHGHGLAGSEAPELCALPQLAPVTLPVSMHCRQEGVRFILQALEKHHSFEGCLQVMRRMEEHDYNSLMAKFVGRVKLALSYEHPGLARIMKAFRAYEDKHPALIDLGDQEWPALVMKLPVEQRPKLFDDEQQLRYHAETFQHLYPALLYQTMDDLFCENPAGFSRAMANLLAQGSRPGGALTRRYQKVADSRHLFQDDVRRKAVWEDQFPAMHVFEIRDRFDQVWKDILSPKNGLADTAVAAFVSISAPRGRSGEDYEFRKVFDQISLNTEDEFAFPLAGIPALHALMDYAESRGVNFHEIVTSLVRSPSESKLLPGLAKDLYQRCQSRREPTLADRAADLLQVLPEDPVSPTRQTQCSVWLNVLLRRIPIETWYSLKLNDDQLLKLYRHLGDAQFLVRVESTERLDAALEHDLGL